MILKILPFVTILLIFLTGINFADSAEIDLNHLNDGKYILTYEEHYYGGVGVSVLTFHKSDSGYLVTWKGITDTTEIYTDFDFNTRKMIFTDKDTSITVERQGNLLKVKGLDKGKRIEKTLAAESPHWYQILFFSLIPFSKSNENKIDFFLFDPYNIKVRDLKINKKGTEIITVLGEQYTAVKMSMRMSGFLSVFWKSELWNSTKSGVNIRYEGLNVVPKMYKAKIFLEKVEFQP